MLMLSPKLKRVHFSLAAIVIVVVFLAIFRSHIPHFQTSSFLVPLNSRRKLHLLLPINSAVARESPRFCKTLLSTLVHGYEPIILNWDVHGESGVLQRMKVIGVYNYLTNITNMPGEYDLVFMMDALDIWLQLSPETLIRRFEDLGTNKVVLGSDKGCWPNEWDSHACQDVPESTLPRGAYGFGPEGSGMSNTRPRWANSGSIMGSVSAMRDLYKDLVDVFLHPNGSYDLGEGDQGVFNEFLASRRFTLDYHSRLFWATSFASPATTASFINTPHPIDRVVPHELYPPLLYQVQTGEIPVAIHFNDHTSKELMESWWGSLWWNQLGPGQDSQSHQHMEGDDHDGLIWPFRHIVEERVQGKSVRFVDGQSKKWHDLCPRHLLGV